MYKYPVLIIKPGNRELYTKAKISKNELVLAKPKKKIPHFNLDYCGIDKKGNYTFAFFESNPDFDSGAALRNTNPGTFKFVQSTERQYACNSHSCSIMGQEGATMPRDINRDGVVDDKDVYVTPGGRKVYGGETIPGIPGTTSFNEDYANMGFTLADVGTKPDPDRVQLIRKTSMKGDKVRYFPEDGHSI